MGELPAVKEQAAQTERPASVASDAIPEVAEELSATAEMAGVVAPVEDDVFAETPHEVSATSFYVAK